MREVQGRTLLQQGVPKGELCSTCLWSSFCCFSPRLLVRFKLVNALCVYVNPFSMDKLGIVMYVTVKSRAKCS